MAKCFHKLSIFVLLSALLCGNGFYAVHAEENSEETEEQVIEEEQTETEEGSGEENEEVITAEEVTEEDVTEDELIEEEKETPEITEPETAETVAEEPAAETVTEPEEEPTEEVIEEEPVILNGLVEIDGKHYFYDAEGNPVKGKEIEIGGKYYFFDANTGAMHINRWHKTGTSYVYYGADGARVSGYQTIRENRYYFNPTSGLMKKGWMKTENGLTYYYFNSKGCMVFGYQTINGKNYSFHERLGKMRKGWKKTDDGKTYFYYNQKGVQLFGDQTINGKKYYFDETTGRMKKGWRTVSGHKVYYGSTGAQVYGSKKISGNWYYFEPDTGYMIKGWRRLDGGATYFYYNTRGVKVFGTYQIGNIEIRTDSKTGAVNYTHISNIPYYSQTDGRWAGIYIGNAGTIAQNGCGPAIGTSIINHYKGKGYNVIDTAKLFNSWGHYNSSYGHGTDTGVWRVLANKYGLHFKNNLSLSEVKEELKKGNVVTAAVGRGTFVNGNYTHFILLYGLDGGRCWVYDPLHSGRNGKYSVDTIYSQRSHIYVDNIDGGPFIALGNQ